MKENRSLNWKYAALNARALAVGVVVGAVLATTYQFVDAKIATAEGGQLLVPLGTQVEFAAWYSVYAGVIIAVVCVPIWLLFVRNRAAHWITAAVLGFIATMGFWIVSNLSADVSVLDIVPSGVAWAFCGAIAGIATWWARPRVQDD